MDLIIEALQEPHVAVYRDKDFRGGALNLFCYAPASRSRSGPMIRPGNLRNRPGAEQFELYVAEKTAILFFEIPVIGTQ
jgi:hypothetical protein